MQIILERTGDSKWYLKHSNVGEGPETVGVLVKLALGNRGSGDDD